MINAIGTTIRAKGFYASGGYTFEPESLAYFARMVVPATAARKLLLDTLIKKLKSDGNWALIDVLYVYASHTLQVALLNLKGDYWNGTAINSPTFYADLGIRGNTTPMRYVEVTGYDPSAGGTLFTRDNAMITAYANGFDGGIMYYVLFIPALATPGMTLFYNTGPATYGRITALSTTALNDGTAGRLGWKALRRNDATFTQFTTGAVEKPPVYRPSTIIPGGYVYIGCYGPVRLAQQSFGAKMDTIHYTNFRDALNTYFTAIGAL